jgi:EmrB/QacA subfamily drug resistance transporter
VPTLARPLSPAAPKRDRPRLVLAIILTCQIMVVLDASIVNIALPHIKLALHFSSASLSWVINAYTLTFGGLLLLGARCGDLLGRRRTFGIGIALFTVASLAGGFATTSAWLLAARAAQGIGAALAAPSALALLMVEFREPRARTRAIGWYTAVSIGGVALGLIAGGMLTEWVSWRWVLFVNVPIGAAVLAFARTSLPETDRGRGRFDLMGALTSTLGMGSIVYAFVRAASSGWGNDGTIGAFIIGGLLIAAFVVTETRAAQPITPLRLFADRNRATSYVARLFMVAGMYGMFFFLTQFLQDVLGYSPLRAGLAFLPLTAALFATSQLSARVLSQRVGIRPLIVGSLILSTLGLAWLTQLSQSSTYVDVLGPLLLFGIGNGLAFVPLTAASLHGVDPADAGAASGLVNVMQQVGGSLGLAVLVSVFGEASRSAARAASHLHTTVNQAPHIFVVGADRAFLASTIFLAATVVLTAVLIRTRSVGAPSTERSTVEPADAPELEAAVS